MFSVVHGNNQKPYNASEQLDFIFVVRSSPNHIYYFTAQQAIDAGIVSTADRSGCTHCYLYDPDDASTYDINPYRHCIIPIV